MNRFPRFPHDFTWGTATSAYQIEGGSDADGKGPSIWDDFCAQKGRVANNDTGDRACDHYNRVEEDVALMKDMGVQAYRFSIAWTRILPNGRTEKINQAGLDFYNHLIDTLLANDIEPWATLYHWDLPLELEQGSEGWVGDEISDLFADYANVCFTQFGDRVKNWITLNEPWVVAVLGYGKGVFAPGIESNHKPYLAAHNLLLAHAKAVDIYRRHHQPHQAGQIGITNNCDWREPLTDKREDQQAAQRALEFFLGWFADPIYLGDYPQSMRERVGDRLPEFTDQQRKLLLGSSDFFGLNHYTTMYAADCPDETPEIHVYGNGGLSEDQGVALTVDQDWAMTDMQWAIVPWGCRKLLQWIDDRYSSPEIYITENGCAFDEHLHNNQERAYRIFCRLPGRMC